MAKFPFQLPWQMNFLYNSDFSGGEYEDINKTTVVKVCLYLYNFHSYCKFQHSDLSVTHAHIHTFTDVCMKKMRKKVHLPLMNTDTVKTQC